tara:strand:- start:1525 stop:2097 length:573 start_codon:yes stop_codon:yes gene_type:complete
MKKHYKTLGLQEGASQQEVQEAYDRLSKELDPANNDNQEFFIEEYKKVQEAYKALHNSSILATDKGARVNTPDKKGSSTEINPPAEVSRRKPYTSVDGIINYILKRKKNIILCIFTILFIKVVFHYFFYPMKFGRGRFLASSPNPNRPGDILSFGSHIDVIFDENLFLFLHSIVIVLFVAWYFNDKIKAR